MTKYLLVHNMSGVISFGNCNILGIPEGTTFSGLHSIVKGMNDRGSGYFRTKGGKQIWIAPYTSNSNLTLNPDPEIYEILTLEEFNNYGFDVTVGHYELK